MGLPRVMSRQLIINVKMSEGVSNSLNPVFRGYLSSNIRNELGGVTTSVTLIHFETTFFKIIQVNT